MFIEILLIIVTLLLILYKFITKDHDYFDKKNIPNIKPFLWFNNFSGMYFGNESMFDSLRRIHMNFKNEKVYGIFGIGGPGIVLSDSEMIKQVMIKDFEYFMNRREILTEQDDPLAGNSVFSMRNEKWRDMRSTLTPAFTGNKMRIMFDLIRECCEEATKYLKNELKDKPDGIELDLKDYFTRFTNDVIASCAFGIKINSLADRDNEFYIMGKKINSFGFWQGIKFLFQMYCKPITRAIGMTLFDKNHVDYFKRLVLDSMKYREEHNIVRPDMINILMEARKAADRKRDWNDYEIVSQCFAFFMAGFETTGATMCFAAIELMTNKDVQSKLMTEIDDVRKNLNGKPITYEILLSMKYLDMVISETFRKWPGAPFFDRVCNKNYTLNISDDYKLPLVPGDSCLVNVFGLHYDPENFPNPDKFDPERFSDENKLNIKPNTYLPFGIGPRNCIGNRFALMEIKAIFYYLLAEFKFEMSEKVILPIKIEEKGIQFKPKGGFWSRICLRNILFIFCEIVRIGKMFSIAEILILLATFLFVFYKFMTRQHDCFVEKNIPHIRPFLWFNNFPAAFFGGESVFDTLSRIHNKFRNEKIYGIFDFFGPSIVLRDPEMIKQVTIKDSDHFMNHRELLTERDDPMFGNSVFTMRGEKWKDMRMTLTPAFTGNKMRIMFDLIRECCEEAVRYLKEELKGNPDGMDLDLKDYFTRFTNDVIATCAFGIKVNSLVDRDNEFYRMGKKINTFDGWVGLKFFLQTNFKYLTRAVGMNLFDKKHVNYFKNLVLSAMKYREEHNIVRPDMINILMEARKAADRKRDWNDYEIVAQCFGFFMAGFETTGTTMCFAAYELMINQDIQEKLVAEIDDVRESLDGKPITYEILLGMKYLDMVVSETFRKWPGAPFIDRICNKDYILKVDEGREIKINIGEAFSVNVCGSHYDEENFPDPKKFDPERFSEDNKNNIKPYTYLPFGSGPRNCIGNRFALMEIKAILYYLLSEFKFVRSKKTVLPIELDARSFQLKPKGGFWLKVGLRN
ncbi:uncharacterized protein LOC129612015 [Condylostylus longicornis]|uniref:uncharacterized protein LOC129612015 n=1 Tax=Condylostylus longicornis TaxID=2530218 RepID=UPI00244E1814|nr:uncharacterized protein LOC129612015 [Condylostylus longicornis]